MNVKQQPVVWFSIPVSNLDRAIAFYNAVFDLGLEATEYEGEKTAFFPMAEGQAGGMFSVDKERAGRNGVILYLNGGEDLAHVLDKITGAEGKVTLPKTDIGQSWGFYAHFLDSEGNELGLWSPG
ncbi:MAG: VOC family protein [Desulfovibrionales bacterium]